MFVTGYKFNIINCTKSFLKQNNSYNFHNRPTSYVIKLNDKIKIGSCNNFYNRLKTYNNMFKNVEILHARGFPADSEYQHNKLFTDRLARITKSYHHEAVKEETILKSVKDLTNKKFSILDLDI